MNSSTTTFIVTILPNPNIKNPSISGTFPDGTVGTLYSNSVYASEGVSPYTWGWDDSQLPPGLGLKSSGGTLTLSGNPKTAGDYSFYVALLDNYNHDCTQKFSLSISESGSSDGNGGNQNNTPPANGNGNNGTNGGDSGTSGNNGTAQDGGTSGGSSGGGGCNAGLGFAALALLGTALISKRSR